MNIYLFVNGDQEWFVRGDQGRLILDGTQVKVIAQYIDDETGRLVYDVIVMDDYPGIEQVTVDGKDLRTYE